MFDLKVQNICLFRSGREAMTSTMSTIDKLLEAARYLEMQEQLKEQQQLQQPFSQAQTTSPTLITTTVVNTSKHKGKKSRKSTDPPLLQISKNFKVINYDIYFIYFWLAWLTKLYDKIGLIHFFNLNNCCLCWIGALCFVQT